MVGLYDCCTAGAEKPHIQNDTVTLHRKAAKDHRARLAISYALSQVGACGVTLMILVRH